MDKHKVIGPTVGMHLGKPIFQVIEADEQRFEYSRIAECDHDGCPLDQLKDGEVMLKSGLIYKKAV